MTAGDKAPDAFRTIGELSRELGIAQHVLRYWEGKFPQLKPLQRAGNRRYYRPADVALVRRIDQWLNRDGYTVRGVQKLLRQGNGDGAAMREPLSREPAQAQEQAQAQPSPGPGDASPAAPGRNGPDVAALKRIRNLLASALDG